MCREGYRSKQALDEDRPSRIKTIIDTVKAIKSVPYAKYKVKC